MFTLIHNCMHSYHINNGHRSCQITFLNIATHRKISTEATSLERYLNPLIKAAVLLMKTTLSSYMMNLSEDILTMARLQSINMIIIVINITHTIDIYIYIHTYIHTYIYIYIYIYKRLSKKIKNLKRK